MTRSAEFSHTVRYGVRAPQRDIVVHAARHNADRHEIPAAQVGFIVSKSVGNAVARHAVTRRLRHAVGEFVNELDPADRIVVRALPSSRGAVSARLSEQLAAGLRKAHDLMERKR